MERTTSVPVGSPCAIAPVQKHTSLIIPITFILLAFALMDFNLLIPQLWGAGTGISGVTNAIPVGRTYELTHPDYVPGRIIIRIAEEKRSLCQTQGLAIPELQADLQSIGLRKAAKLFPSLQAPVGERNSLGQKFIDISLIYELEIDPSFQLEAAINRLLSHDFILYAEPRYVYPILYVPTDPYAAGQYHLTDLQAFDAWDIEQGDSNIVVGIIDTGTSFLHPELKDKIACNTGDTLDGIDNDNDGYIDNHRGWDFAGGAYNLPPDNDPSYVGVANAADHGVIVSGPVAGETDNGYGQAAVGFNTQIVPLKASFDNSTGISYGYDAIVYAATHNIPIMNLSWGSTGYSQYGKDVTDFAAINHSCLVVAAAGNTPGETRFYPASYPGVTSVAGTMVIWDTSGTFYTSDHVWFNYANFGTTYNYDIDICAPAYHVQTIQRHNGFYPHSGTSLASPIVAGAAAIVKAHFPGLNPIQAGQKIRVTADNIYNRNPDPKYNGKLANGRVNLFRALTENKPSVRIDSIWFTDHNDQVARPYDTLDLYFRFINYLDPTQGLTATLSVVDTSVLEVIQAVINVGQIPTLNSRDLQTPFKVVVKGDVSKKINTYLRLDFSDPNYSYTDFEYAKFEVFPFSLDIDVNHLHTSLGLNGSFGITDFPGNLTGLGLNYKGYGNVLQEGGFLVGKSPAQLADAVRNITNTVEQDFASSRSYEVNLAGPLADYEGSVYLDDSRTVNPMNLEITTQAYANTDSLNEDYVILEYSITNTGGNALSNVYAGLFMNLNSFILPVQAASYDQTANSVYAQFQAGAQEFFTGIKLLSLQSPNAFVQQRYLYNFSDVDKFWALSQGTQNAQTVSGDVIEFISAGPFDLAPGQTERVAFALMGADDFLDFQEVASQAFQTYHCKIALTLPPLDLGPDLALCDKNKTALIDPAITGPFLQYNWSTGDSTPTLSINAGGIYSLEIINKAGCKTKDSVRVSINPPVTGLMVSNPTPQVGEWINMAPIGGLPTYHYNWNFGDGQTLINSPVASHAWPNSGTYDLTLRSDEGLCSDTVINPLLVSPLTQNEGLLAGQEMIFEAYPNPAINFVNLKVAGAYMGEVEIGISDIQGRELMRFRQAKNAETFQTRVDLSGFATGFYLITVSTEEYSYSRKLQIR